MRAQTKVALVRVRVLALALWLLAPALALVVALAYGRASAVLNEDAPLLLGQVLPLIFLLACPGLLLGRLVLASTTFP